MRSCWTLASTIGEEFRRLTPDYINPEKPWPHLEQLRLRTESKGFELRQRLPVYPEFLPALTSDLV